MTSDSAFVDRRRFLIHAGAVARALAEVKIFDERSMRPIDRDNALRLIGRLDAAFR